MKRPATSNESDENYVISLCDQILEVTGSKQWRFEYLRGDTRNPDKPGRQLRVDVYYAKHNLVLEYRERQHTESVLFFDKPHKTTVSGISRGKQRTLYDQRRRDVLEEHGVLLIEIEFSDLPHHKTRKRLLREKEKDLIILKKILEDHLKIRKPRVGQKQY